MYDFVVHVYSIDHIGHESGKYFNITKPTCFCDSYVSIFKQEFTDTLAFN